MTKMMVCHKRLECTKECDVKSPHMKEPSCDEEGYRCDGGCPKCVPFSGKREDRLLGATNKP